ncbi:hypothetical protein K502DRAFT_367343 [Neoconidiobolus thromboides FSU 785]|nr:hypothetical protein K502DRAFT_367343 [Neoconidiobolus thromboides FSU 785]
MPEMGKFLLFKKARSAKKVSTKTPSSSIDKEEKEYLISCVCSSKDNNASIIQCENCKVWQHSLCVNIIDEESKPSPYFCKKCVAILPVSKLTKKEDDENVVTSQNEGTKDSTIKDDDAKDINKKEGNTKEFITKRGRKVTKVNYDKSSEEEKKEKARKAKESATGLKNAKKSKIKHENSEEPNKKIKAKKHNPEISKNKLTFDVSSPVTTHLMKEHLNIQYDEPVEKEDTQLFNENEIMVKLPPPSMSLSTIIERGPSPPPKARTINSKISFKDMIKRANYMKGFIENYQTQLSELDENKVRNNYSTSSKLAFKLKEQVDGFLTKFSKYNES